MNIFYRAYRNSNELKELKDIDLFLGDDRIGSKFSSFELLLTMNNENHCSNMECIFLLSAPQFLLEHPESFSIKIPLDLLQKNESYQYRKYLTNADTLDGLGEETNFNYYFNNEIRYTKGLIFQEARYKTVNIPYTDEIMCRDFVGFANNQLFESNGYLFKFSIQIPNINNQISNNNFNDCSIDKLHTGSGDNK